MVLAGRPLHTFYNLFFTDRDYLINRVAGIRTDGAKAAEHHLHDYTDAKPCGHRLS